MKIIPIIDEASPLMTNVCPLTDGVQAFRDLENNRDGKMKGVPGKLSVVRNEADPRRKKEGLRKCPRR